MLFCHEFSTKQVHSRMMLAMRYIRPHKASFHEFLLSGLEGKQSRLFLSYINWQVSLARLKKVFGLSIDKLHRYSA